MENIFENSSKAKDQILAKDNVFHKNHFSVKKIEETKTLQNINHEQTVSNVDTLNAALEQVSNSLQEQRFNEILQGILKISSNKYDNDLIWDATEKFLNRISQFENYKDAEQLLSAITNSKFKCAQCTVNDKIEADQSKPLDLKRKSVIPIAPTPCPPPPPPPPPASLYSSNQSSGPPPPPPPVPSFPSKSSLSTHSATNLLLPQQMTPAPKKKMKILSWDKISPHDIMGKANLWTTVAKNHSNDIIQEIDWQEAECLFELQSPANATKLSKNLKETHEFTKIHLLDVQSSMHIDICLKQFKGKDIVQLIQNGDHETIGAEKLKFLFKSLSDEQEMLKNFNGDFQRLGEAEKFLIQLMKVSNCKLRLESMILKDEFAEQILNLHNSINGLIKAGNDLLKNKYLHEILYIIVMVGNFLNSGIYAGNAVGFKLSTLSKLGNLRSNKNGMNFISFIVKLVEKRNTTLLNFFHDLESVEGAAKINLDQVSKDIKSLKHRVFDIKTQINLPNSDPDIQKQMKHFIYTAEIELNNLLLDMDNVDSMRLKLCEFFCEQPENFKIQECFNIFQIFIDEFKQALKNNEKLKQIEEEKILRQAKINVNKSYRASLGNTFHSKGNQSLNNGFRALEISTANGESLSVPSLYDMAQEDDLVNSLQKLSYGYNSPNVQTRSHKRPDLLNINCDDKRERSVLPNLKAQEISPINNCNVNLRSDKKYVRKFELPNREDQMKFKPTTLVNRISKMANDTQSLNNETPRAGDTRPIYKFTAKPSKNIEDPEKCIKTVAFASLPKDNQNDIKHDDEDEKIRASLRRAQKIGRRYSSIKESELEIVKTSLRKTTPNAKRKSYWDRPREIFMEKENGKNTKPENKLRRYSSINKADLENVRKNLKSIKGTSITERSSDLLFNNEISSTNDKRISTISSASNISAKQYLTPEPMPQDWNPFEKPADFKNDIEIKAAKKSKLSKDVKKQKTKEKSCIIS